jgi:O-antigen/teichoic acid export membrane protein
VADPEPSGLGADASTRAPGPSGARSGALLAAASLVGIVANYAFLLAAGRYLGVEDYGALAALMGLLTVVLLPTGAVQMAVSREVARRLGSGAASDSEEFVRAVIRLSALATLPLVGLAVVLSVPVGLLLDLDYELVLLASVGLATAFLMPASLGVLQGYQRFRALAAMYVLPFLLRLALLALAFFAGLRLGGAVVATVVAVLVTAALALALIREPLRRGASRIRPSLRAFVRYLVPVTFGLIGIAVLTNVDILVVRARFSEDDAGLYAAASAFARVAFFLPATVLAVVFPRTAARQARGEQTGDILGRALVVTAAFTGVLALAYVLTGEGLIVSSFGADFAAAGSLLPAYALSMGLYAIANVLVGYHLSRGETRYAWFVACAVPVQVAAIAFVPGSLEGVIWTNIVVAIVLVAAHELAIGSSLPAIRAGVAHLVPAPLATRLRRIAREGGIALVGYSTLAVLVTWPLVRGLGSTFIGDERNDAAGTIGWFWRLRDEGGYHLFGASTHELTGAPFGWEEGNALNLQWLVPYYPASLLSSVAGEVFAYNVVILSGLVLSAIAMYALARYLGCRPLVAAWAGVAYMLLPWVMWRVNAGHASLTHVWVLALVLLALVAWSRRPSLSRAALVGAAVTIAWLTSGYFGVMAALAAFAFVAGVTIVELRGVAGPRVVARNAAVAVGAVVLGTLVLGVLSLPGRVEGGAAIERHVSNLWIYGARPAEFLVPPERHPLLGPLFDPIRPGLHESRVAETTLFLGWLTIALALGWLVLVARRRRALGAEATSIAVALAGVVVVAFGFSLASPLDVFGIEVRMPSWLLFHVLPEARVPSRFTILVATALIPLAALGLQALSDRVRHASPRVADGLRRSRLVVGFVMLLTALELAPSLGQPLDADATPLAYRALEETPDGVLAEYPLGPPGTNTGLEYALWQRKHGRPELNGARLGSAPDEARLTLVDPAAEGTAEALALLGVTAVTVRGDGLGYVNGFPKGRFRDLGPGYELVQRLPDQYSVWRVVATPAPALATLPSEDFGAPREPRGGFVGFPLEGDSGRIELRAPAPATVLVAFEARSGAPARLRVSGLEGAVEVGVGERVQIPVRVPAGLSELAVEMSRPAGAAAAVLLSPPRASRTTLAPVVSARPVSGDSGLGPSRR